MHLFFAEGEGLEYGQASVYGVAASSVAAARLSTHTGRALGSERFLSKLEKLLVMEGRREERELVVIPVMVSYP